MTNTTITKAVQAAEQFTKGGSPTLRSHDYEQAMLDFAEQHRVSGEDGAAAFARLTKANDPTIELLWAATSLARTYEHHGAVLAKRQAAAPAADDKAQAVLRMAEANIDACVKMNQQPGESVEQTTARLARDGDATFSKVYGALVETRRLVAG